MIAWPLRSLGGLMAGALFLAIATGAFAAPHLPCEPAAPDARIPHIAVPHRPAKLAVASWYGPRHQGRPTASGEIFDAKALTAAHPTLPFGTRVAVTNLNDGRVVEVCINDRGPFASRRSLDLSEAAARLIGIDLVGVARVEISLLLRQGDQ